MSQKKSLLIAEIRDYIMIGIAMISYGIGWQNQRDWNGRDYFGHTGMGVGGFGWLSVYPNEQVVIVMLFNVTDPQISIYLQRLTDFILEGAKLTDQPTLIENP